MSMCVYVCECVSMLVCMCVTCLRVISYVGFLCLIPEIEAMFSSH